MPDLFHRKRRTQIKMAAASWQERMLMLVGKGWGFDSTILAALLTFWSHVLDFWLPRKQFRMRLRAVTLKPSVAQMQDDWKLPEFHWSPSHRHSIPLLPTHGIGWPFKRGQSIGCTPNSVKRQSFLDGASQQSFYLLAHLTHLPDTSAGRKKTIFNPAKLPFFLGCNP